MSEKTQTILLSLAEQAVLKLINELKEKFGHTPSYYEECKKKYQELNKQYEETLKKYSQTHNPEKLPVELQKLSDLVDEARTKAHFRVNINGQCLGCRAIPFSDIGDYIPKSEKLPLPQIFFSDERRFIELGVRDVIIRFPYEGKTYYGHWVYEISDSCDIDREIDNAIYGANLSKIIRIMTNDLRHKITEGRIYPSMQELIQSIYG